MGLAIEAPLAVTELGGGQHARSAECPTPSLLQQRGRREIHAPPECSAAPGSRGLRQRGRGVGTQGWTVFQIPSTPWVPAHCQIGIWRSRLGVS